MRAALLDALGGPDAVRIAADAPAPVGAHPMGVGGRLLVEVHAAGVSFPDLLRSRGEYQMRPELPFAIGAEVAGVVAEAPEGSPLAVGDRIAALTHWGAVAEYALAMPQHALRLPDHLSYAQGAALYLNYCTAYYALHRVGVTAGETVLVQGAAGGVGTAALEIVAALGARSIAVVSNEAKEHAARALGADEVVRSTGDWLAAVRALTDGRGVQAVVDPVGGDRFTDSLRALAIGGRLAVVGFTGGSIPELKVNRLLLRNLMVCGVEMVAMDAEEPGTVQMVNDGVQALVDAGKVRTLVGAQLPLDDAAEALRVLDRRDAIGKVVVTVRG
ncbi:MAG TPA: NADPH:quinone oxidoreductase family protein [Baekduia sp.]|uniref:NADPH:quinone oxidoreductase family protein n=1 Tax=Baekduia sp. TaxID=2600305 RepID=UPI002D791A1A|nr:NADPH:quinone oxidoreductase family protein [Baekduia sp.]HET6507918.1 NADPH:quinone oxidoreductase family protein [Baekduia sp.]